jgi:acetyl-CoA C-acetyltransferase
LAKKDTVAMSVPVVQAMSQQASPGAKVDFAIWGTVAQSIRYSNVAREIWLDSKLDPTVPTASVVMACATSLMAAIEAAGMVSRGRGELAVAGGVESMSHVQIGLAQPLSDWLRQLSQSRDWRQRAKTATKPAGFGLSVPSLKNRTTRKSMGEHCEEMAKTWDIGREEQDALALKSHQNAVAAQKRGFFNDLIVPVDGVNRDAFPRETTSLAGLAKLSPSFDRTSGRGTLTAGNSSPLTDGAAGSWVVSDEGLSRLPSSVPRVRFVDSEIAAVDVMNEGLLMAPAYAIPRLLARNGLRYEDIGLWEIHEAFAAQVLCTVKALETPSFLKDKVGIDAVLGAFPRDRVNLNGGSVALGHPFGATGARLLSQTTKELASRPSGTRAIISICADGGLGAVALLEAA